MLELRDRALVELPLSSARHGLGLFESIRVRDGKALRLAWHLERLASGARFLRMDAPPGEDEVARFARGSCALGDTAEGVLRLYALDGFLVPVLSPGLPAPLASRRADLAATLRRSSSSPLCRFKTLSYLENIMLAREAEERGLAEVIALNEAGRLSDGGRTTLFIVKGGLILTPPVGDGALPGIARRLLLESGLACEAPLYPADVSDCDGAFIANSLRSVVALEGFGGRDLDPQHPMIGKAARLFGEG
ncbi:MAG: aminotransferase class IV [Spirochaetota bacterium]